jgi:secreted trypsin-like serine protease
VLWLGPGERLQLVGVISYGKGCATQYPGVNTRIYPYIDWIISVTPGESEILSSSFQV